MFSCTLIHKMPVCREGVKRAFVLLSVAWGALIAISASGAEEERGPIDRPRWSAALYSGVSFPGTITDVYAGELPDRVEPYGLLAVALGRELFGGGPLFSGEFEAQIVKPFESWSLFETNALFTLRLHRVPWGRWLGGSFAFGNGLSYATRVPEVEAKDYATASRLLYYFMFEFSADLPQRWLSSSWEAFLRIHHRSGMFGVIAERGVGSNFLCLGLRHRF